MCLSPLKILNHCKSYIPGRTAQYVEVPCGKCSDCLRQKQDEWFTRSWFHVDHVRKHGGMTFFVTFTYSDKALPIYNIKLDEFRYGKIYKGFNPDYDPEFDVPVFSKADKDRFLNSLRVWYKRHYDSDLSYIWYSEYGLDARYTHRPHYHALIHFHKSFDVEEGKRKCEDFWRRCGMVRWSQDHGAVANSDQAAAYSAKYACKDLDWFDQPQVNKYLYDDHGEKIWDNWDKLSPYLPHHWQSKGYGVCLVEQIMSGQHPEDVFYKGLIIQPECQRKGQLITHPVPSYVLNKLCYYYLPDGRRDLTDFGVFLKDRLSELSRVRDVQKVQESLDSDTLRKKLSSDDLTILRQEFSLQAATFEALSSELKTFISSQHNDDKVYSYDLEGYCFFHRYLKGRPVLHSGDIEYLDTCSVQERNDYSLHLFRSSLERSVQNFVYHDSGYFKEKDTYTLYDDAQCFQGYIYLRKILNRINAIYKDRLAELSRERIMKNKLLNHMIV